MFAALIFGFICLGLTYVASLLGGVLQVRVRMSYVTKYMNSNSNLYLRRAVGILF